MNIEKAKDQMQTGADVDELVIGGSRQGRPLSRRTLTALVSGAAVMCAAGLVGTLGLDNGTSPSPAAQTTPSASGGPGAPASSGAMTQTQLEILAVIKAKLPGELKVTAHHGIGTRSIVAMSIADSQGHTWVHARVGTTGDESWDPCRAARNCSVDRVKGGTLYTLEELESSGNGTHYAATYTYERPDGRYVNFGQSNIFNPDGRRSSLPLSDQQVRDMLTATEWDGVLADCKPDPGANC